MDAQTRSTDPGTPRSRWLAHLLVVAALLLTLLPHRGSLRGEFVFDDIDFIARNHSITSLSHLPTVFTSAFPPEDPARGLYRPLTATSYALDHAIWGEVDAPSFHRTHRAWYALCVVLVYAVALSYLESLPAAALMALLFSLHPVHVEVADSLTGRSELLGLLLCLASLLAFHRASGFRRTAPGPRALYGLSVLLWVMACFAKETAVVFPGVLWLHVFFFGGGKALLQRLRSTLVTAPWFALVPVYFFVRVSVLERFRPDDTILGGAPLSTKLFTMGAIFQEYLRLLFFPDVLQVDYYYEHFVGTHSALTPMAAAGLTLLVVSLGVMAALIVRALRDDRGGPWSVLAFGFCAFFVFAFPTSHIIAFGALMAERFMFSPSFPFLLGGVALGVLLVERWPVLRLGLVVGALGVCALFWVRSAERSKEWVDILTLMEPLHEMLPFDERVSNNVGNGYLRRGQFEMAFYLLEDARKKVPGSPTIQKSLAAAYLKTRQELRALELYRAMVEKDPRDAVAWTGIGIVELRRWAYTEAASACRKALEINPNYTPAHKNLASAEKGITQARAYLQEKKEETLASPDPTTVLYLAQACRAVGDSGCEEQMWTLWEQLTGQPAPRGEFAQGATLSDPQDYR